MNRTIMYIILGLALALIGTLLAVYLNTFGFQRSTDQAVWGTFGDYFGGILNPIFALFAFLAVLWSLHLQVKQLGQIAFDKQGEEILHVIKDIDSRLSELARTKIGIFDMLQIASEAERNVKISERSEVYKKFLRHAKEPGVEVEPVVRDMSIQVESMYDFLRRHPKSQNGGLSPVIEYYVIKTSRLVPMLEAVGSVSVDARNFFITAVK